MHIIILDLNHQAKAHGVSTNLTKLIKYILPSIVFAAKDSSHYGRTKVKKLVPQLLKKNSLTIDDVAGVMQYLPERYELIYLQSTKI